MSVVVPVEIYDLNAIAFGLLVVKDTAKVAVVPVVAGVTVSDGADVYPEPALTNVIPVIRLVDVLTVRVAVALTPPATCGALNATVAVAAYAPFVEAFDTVTVLTLSPPTPLVPKLPKNVFLIGRPMIFLLSTFYVIRRPILHKPVKA